jgi:hypothetical protein
MHHSTQRLVPGVKQVLPQTSSLFWVERDSNLKGETETERDTERKRERKRENKYPNIVLFGERR